MADRLSSTHKRVDDLPRGPGRRTNRTAPRSQTAPQATAATLRDRATVSGQQPGPPIAPHQATIPSLPPHNRPCSFPRPRDGPQSNPFAAPHSATNPRQSPPAPSARRPPAKPQRQTHRRQPCTSIPQKTPPSPARPHPGGLPHPDSRPDETAPAPPSPPVTPWPGPSTPARPPLARRAGRRSPKRASSGADRECGT
jgi:hypothetical protein